jgi:hypothetical protein
MTRASPPASRSTSPPEGYVYTPAIENADDFTTAVEEYLLGPGRRHEIMRSLYNFRTERAFTRDQAATFYGRAFVDHMGPFRIRERRRSFERYTAVTVQEDRETMQAGLPTEARTVRADVRESLRRMLNEGADQENIPPTDVFSPPRNRRRSRTPPRSRSPGRRSQRSPSPNAPGR